MLIRYQAGMAFDPGSLPRDPDRLIAIIMDLQESNENLQGQVAALQRMVFGPRSEKLAVDPAQLELVLPDVEIVSAVPAANDDDPAARTAKAVSARRKPVRNIGVLPKHLPRCDVVIEPESKTCPCCQGALHPIGEDVTEQLDVIPAILQVKRIRRPRYGCRGCEGAVVQEGAGADRRQWLTDSRAGYSPHHVLRIILHELLGQHGEAVACASPSAVRIAADARAPVATRVAPWWLFIRLVGHRSG